VQLSDNSSELPFARDLRVPVQRAHVEVQTERDHRRAVIFLPPGSSPAEFFEDGRAFFPAEAGGEIRLYARSSVVSLVVDGGEPSGELAGELPSEERGIQIQLRNGTVLRGAMRALSGRDRTLDLMNESGRSLALQVDGRTVHVAKAHIECIEESR
jgi:hypothetical protein